MGTGDWNDGMNRVGAGGKGESVWLAWFLIAVSAASPAWPRRAATRRARPTCAGAPTSCRSPVEANAWDGDWYRRAYFDDGTPLGSAQQRRVPDRLARPDLGRDLPARPTRTAPGRRWRPSMPDLVDRQGRLILLFTPPFDDEPIDPGYIKGYVPGIRENGGQYTHAATWVVQAFAALGQRPAAPPSC